MSRPVAPAFPWLKGKHPEYEAFVVEMTVCKDKLGRVYSAHDLQDDADREVALSWMSGGQEQVAFALLTEAVRREAILGILMLMSKDETFLAQLDVMTPEEREREFSKLEGQIIVSLRRTIDAITHGATRDAYDVICSAKTVE